MPTPYQQNRYQIGFLSPAFLGNASQSAQWRTPPIKALLRQWWRVAYAANQGFNVDVATMRHEEGLLFGHAWLEDDSFEHSGRQVKTSARQSAVRLRLSHWNEGQLKHWQASAPVRHEEVGQIGSDLYLGYGPLTLPRGSRQPVLKANAAIQAGESASLALAYPKHAATLMEHALGLLDRFGTLGGRSRNGWGSLHLLPQEHTPALQGHLPLRDWRQALTLDWPHAIGADGDGALLWQTPAHTDWKSLVRQLAQIKIALRTQFVFPNQRPDGEVHDRHWLSYPVTNHSVNAWGSARLPNSLRFKVRPAPQNPEQLIGVIYHMPCLPPPAFRPDHRAIAAVWQRVHAHLDGQLNRIPA